MLKVGLTGNIAAGKSEVEKIFKDFGFLVTDLDEVSHFVLENDCKDAILKEFKTLERKKIASVVFKDPFKKEKLEKIIYPILKEKIEKFFDENKKEPFCIVSGALLYESEFNTFFDKIIFVDAPKAIRLERLMKRNNLNQKDALLRINSQNTKYKTQADFIIENTSDINNLKIEAEKIIKALKLL